MYTEIIGTQQILITAAFLGVMILLLIILRKKSTVIRASMKAGKRINIIEDTAVSPTERLRLVSIDLQILLWFLQKATHRRLFVYLLLRSANCKAAIKHKCDWRKQ